MEKCILCGSTSQAIENGGTILTKDGVSAHHYCLYFASGLAQRGDEDKGEGLSGFLPSDIRAEARRSGPLKCIVCSKNGASIGCSVRRCRRTGHYACLKSHNYIFQHFGNFEAFCPSHSPKQRSFPSQQSDCPVCLSVINPKPGFSQLYCPSCRTYFHRHCVQNQALSAGRYYLRCPVCNNKDSYMEELLKMGIDVPEKDAEWERSGMFVEDVEASKYCHADTCCCNLGRGHHSGIGKYKMRKCESCGQWMGHVLCLKGQPEQCVDCISVPVRKPTAPPQKVVTPSQAVIPQQSAETPSLSHQRASSSHTLSTSVQSKSSTSSVHRKSFLSLQSGTLKRKFLGPRRERCSCSVCVARYSVYDTNCSDCSTDSSLTTESNDVRPRPPARKPLIVSIPLRKLQKARVNTAVQIFRQTSIRSFVESTDRTKFSTGPHPSLRALAKRHPGLKHLVSVSLPHYSCRQLITRYKQKRMRKKIYAKERRRMFADSALLTMLWDSLIGSGSD